MRKLLRFGLLAGALAVLAVPAAAVSASPSGSVVGDESATQFSDNLDGPYSKEQREDRAKAKQLQLQGKVGKGDKVAKIGKGRYVQLARESTDKIFVVIVEFGNERYEYPPDPNRFLDTKPDGTPASNAQRFDGPLHNEIPEPDRSEDNTTLWQPDFSQGHYENMYFNRMARYYETQSSGRYSVEGAVTSWVKVPFNEALYGRDYCGSIVCASSRSLVRDALAEWVQQQLDGGRTMAQIQDYLSTFDNQDRYDVDGDGNFNEPDGFIDHFQIVHAGGDQAAGDPIYGTDAIWSHRSYANLQAGGPGGTVGVDIGSNGGLYSSTLVPNNPTGIWVGDYTMQPENGGLGVFAHEFGHDLGLPDLYDTSGNTGGAENSTAFWTLMSSGANIGDGGPDGIGDNPTDLGAWEKFQLGWLDYDVAFAGEKSSHRLGPAEGQTRNGKQGLFVVLPDKSVPLQLGDPCSGCGSKYFYSGAGNDLDVTMTKSGVSGSSLTAKVRYEIEEDWDYAFLEASPDGSTWTQVVTNLSDAPGHTGHNQSGFNDSGAGLTGSTGGNWLDLTATLPSGTTAVRFRYETDPAVAESGFQVDQIAVDGTPIGTAETDSEGWVFDGFRTTTGSEEQFFFNAYVAENRGYRSYDTSLKTAYNFGFLDTRPDWVESYPYQDGLLISYWDSSYTDNNVGDHPGEGLVLPVDAHPTFHHDSTGNLLRPRILSYDSAFGKQKTKGITVHINSQASSLPSQSAVPTFDDTKDYWFDCDADACTGSHQGRYQPGWNSVKVPKTGTTVTVTSGGPQSAFLQVEVAPK
jgi:immune inhibitor A